MRRAFTLLFKTDASHVPLAEVVNVEDGHFVAYDVDDWMELSSLRQRANGSQLEWIRAVRFNILVPRIVRVLTFAKIPCHELKFSRRNILARDEHTCQYCRRLFPSSELTLDHVMPRSRSGPTTWENVVCACQRCNVKKGDRTPGEAGLPLLRVPKQPSRNPFLYIKNSHPRYAAWRPFLDKSHWEVQSA